MTAEQQDAIHALRQIHLVWGFSEADVPGSSLAGLQADDEPEEL